MKFKKTGQYVWFTADTLSDCSYQEQTFSSFRAALEHIISKNYKVYKGANLEEAILNCKHNKNEVTL